MDGSTAGWISRRTVAPPRFGARSRAPYGPDSRISFGFVSNNYWSSTENNNNNAWYQNFNDGSQNNNNKNNGNYVRCIRKFRNDNDYPMGERITLEDVFQAYYDCRRNKARTANAIAFGLDYEARLIELFEDISA